MRIKILKPHEQQIFTLNYLFKKEENSKSELMDNKETLIEKVYSKKQKCVKILGNLDNNSPENWKEITKKYCDIRAEKTGFSNDWNKNTMHLVISVHPEDGPKIANAWMEVVGKLHEELGIGTSENNSIAWLHRDVDHHHVHLLFSKMDYKGAKFNDSNLGRKLNDIANRFDLEYDLLKGTNQAHKVSNRTPIKNNLVKELNKAYKSSASFKDFTEELQKKNIKTSIITPHGEPQIVYIDIAQNKEFHESSLENKYCYRNISQMDPMSKEKPDFSYEQQKKYVTNSVSKALNKAKNLDEFEKILATDFGIKFIKSHKKSGEVFGCSFQQEGVKTTYSIKGSSIGFAYSKISYYLEQNSTGKETIVPVIKSDERGPNNERENFEEKTPNLPGLIQQNDDEEEQRRKRKRRKNRNI